MRSGNDPVPTTPLDHVDVFASLSSDYVNFGTATPPPKPPRAVQHPWWTVDDRSSPTDCEGSFTSVQSSGLREDLEEEDEENRRRLLFLRFQLSTTSAGCIELSDRPTDGVSSLEFESSGATAAAATLLEEIEEAESSLRTSGDETHPSAADDEDDDECDATGNGHLSHTHGDRDFRLEDARLLWLLWRKVVTSAYSARF